LEGQAIGMKQINKLLKITSL